MMGFFFSDNFDLKWEYVVGNAPIPLNTNKVTADILDVMLNGPFG
jgi:hypothetical protein